MVIDRTLAAAFIDNNVRHRILGRRLQPFSLWHRFLLMTVQSPFMTGGKLTPFDIREAVAVCSLRYPNCKIRRPWIVFTVWFFLASIIFRRKIWFKKLIRTKDKLMDYFGDYISRPEYSLWFPEIHGNGSAPPPRLGPVPEVFTVLADVIGFLKCSPEEAWNTPVGQAYWWQLASLRGSGEHINFLDESEREFQEKLRTAAKR